MIYVMKSLFPPHNWLVIVDGEVAAEFRSMFDARREARNLLGEDVRRHDRTDALVHHALRRLPSHRLVGDILGRQELPHPDDMWERRARVSRVTVSCPLGKVCTETLPCTCQADRDAAEAWKAAERL